ncbi:MAG: hypothetical protein IJA86_06305 [Clostridia bacterium]|nr:hypothetical protein [Clostridia bacterium]
MYTYAFAQDVSYTSCTFEDGVVVYGNAVFDACTFETFRANDLCLILDNKGYDCTIKNCTFTAKEDAESCVVSNGTNALTVQNSQFMNSTEYPAIVLNGETAVTTDKQNMFYSEDGGILAMNEDCTFNGESCLTRAQYQNADQLTKSKYDQTENGNNGGVKSPDHLIGYKTPAADAIIPELSEIQTDANGAYLINTAEEFIAVMSMLNESADLSKDITIILQGHFDLSDYDFTGVTINDPNKVMQTITIKADTETLGTSTAFIKGLKVPLFGNVKSEASAARIVLEDITIIGAEMTLDTSDYENAGAFISNADFKSGSVLIRNCHLLNSTISSAPNAANEYSRTGGIVGYTKTSDFRIEDCSVRGCTLTGASAGGIVGHASASQSNNTYIVDCFVENTTIACVEEGASWRVGEFVGTANQGCVSIVNPMVSEILKNTLTQEGVADPHSNDDPYKTLYGRFVPSDSGSLTFVDTKTNAELHSAVVYGRMHPNTVQCLTSDKQEWLLYGTVALKEEMRFTGNEITVKAYGGENATATLVLNSVVTSESFGKGQTKSASGFNFGNIGDYKTSFKPGSKFFFENLIIQNKKSYTTSKVVKVTDDRSYTYAYAETVVFDNCIFIGGVTVYANAEFDGCTFQTKTSTDNLCLILSTEKTTLGDFDCILKDCMFPGDVIADYIETNNRQYTVESTQTPTE